MADRLVESLGGRDVWAAAKTLYVRERAYPASINGPVTAEFWRDLEKPAYRSVVVGSGVNRETRWDEDGGWVVRDGAKSEIPEENVRADVIAWRQEPYVMYHKLALHDPTLHLKSVDGRKLEIYDGPDGRLLCWFVVDASGALLVWGNIYDGEVSEHVYGPLRQFGEFRMPAWGTSTNGGWRFEYEEVIGLSEPLDIRN